MLTKPARRDLLLLHVVPSASWRARFESGLRRLPCARSSDVPSSRCILHSCFLNGDIDVGAHRDDAWQHLLGVCLAVALHFGVDVADELWEIGESHGRVRAPPKGDSATSGTQVFGCWVLMSS